MQVAMPATDVDYPVTLGRTLSSDHGSHAEQFITLRYDFKPASLAREGEGELELHPDSHKAVVRLPSSASGAAPLAFAGKHEPSRDGLDCVAIFDGEGFRLEVLGAAVKNLKHAPGASRGGPAPRAPKAAAAAAAPPAAAPELDFADSLMLEEELFRAMAEEAAEAGAAAAPAEAEAEAMETDAPAAAAAAPAAAPAAPSSGGAAGPPPSLAAAPAAARPAPPPPALLPKRNAPRPEEMNDLDREFFGGFGGDDSPDVADDTASSGSEEEEEEGSEGADAAAKGGKGGAQNPKDPGDEFI